MYVCIYTVFISTSMYVYVPVCIYVQGLSGVLKAPLLLSGPLTQYCWPLAVHSACWDSAVFHRRYDMTQRRSFM